MSLHPSLAIRYGIHQLFTDDSEPSEASADDNEWHRDDAIGAREGCEPATEGFRQHPKEAEQRIDDNDRADNSHLLLRFLGW